MADPKRLGKIAGKTIGTFVGFYVCGATLESYNPLTTVINAVPSNIVEVLGSNNSDAYGCDYIYRDSSWN